MRLPLAFALVAGLMAGTAAAQPMPEHHDLPAPAGLARFILPGGGLAPVPLVIMLPDAPGEMGRAEAYADALARHGIASLVLGIGDEAGDHPAVPAASAAAVPVALAWAAARETILDRQAVVVLGFGAGAHAALAAAPQAAVVIDPGCAGLGLADEGRRVLLLHGAAAEDAEDCGAFSLLPHVAVHEVQGVAHGWDLPVVAAPGTALLPHPMGGGRRRAWPDPIATEAAAELVARWVGHVLFREPAR